MCIYLQKLIGHNPRLLPGHLIKQQYIHLQMRSHHSIPNQNLTEKNAYYSKNSSGKST